MIDRGTRAVRERSTWMHAVALGRKGGKKGGKARWEGVSSEERREIVRKAALARWRRDS